MNYAQAEKALKGCGQEHVLAYWKKLSKNSKLITTKTTKNIIPMHKFTGSFHCIGNHHQSFICHIMAPDIIYFLEPININNDVKKRIVPSLINYIGNKSIQLLSII